MGRRLKLPAFKFYFIPFLIFGFLLNSASLSFAASTNISDPSTYVTETHSDVIGWGNSLIYPRERKYTFFCGAEGDIKVTLSSNWLRYLGLSLLDAQGNLIKNRDLYYKGSPYTTSFWVSPGRYTVRVSDAGWGAYTSSISYTVSIRHAQSAPQIELSSPANCAVVSHNVLVEVDKKNLLYNPEIASLDFLVKGNLAKNFNSEPYQLSLDTDSFENGWHNLEFRAYDSLGRYNPLFSSIQVKNQYPDTKTISYKDRIGWGSSLLYPQALIYPFEMRREGYFNASISGDRSIRYLAWIVRDSSGTKKHYHDFYYDGTYVRRSIYLEKGKYTLRVLDCGFYPLAPYISYILTLDYPAQKEIFKNIEVERSPFDPSEDNQGTSLETTTLSYRTLEDAYISVKVKDEDGTTIRTLLSHSYQEPSVHTLSWDGKDSQGRIAEEGEFKFILEAFDDKDILLDTASANVEVLYHMGY